MKRKPVHRRDVFEVAARACNECLLSENRIVRPERAREIIDKCLREQTHFTCHKYQLQGRDVCCRAFFNVHGQSILKIRLARELNLVRLVRLQREGTEP